MKLTTVTHIQRQHWTKKSTKLCTSQARTWAIAKTKLYENQRAVKEAKREKKERALGAYAKEEDWWCSKRCWGVDLLEDVVVVRLLSLLELLLLPWPLSLCLCKQQWRTRRMFHPDRRIYQERGAMCKPEAQTSRSLWRGSGRRRRKRVVCVCVFRDKKVNNHLHQR